MDYNKHRSCILNSCCLCFSVETGARIIAYLGIGSNAINIIYGIIMIVSLAVGPAPAPNVTSTTEWPVTSNDSSLYNDVNVNLADDIKVNFFEPLDSNLEDNVTNMIILLLFSLVVNIFTLSSNVVMLIGLVKRLATYVKFGLVVNTITVAVAFVITVGVVIVYPSVATLAALVYYVVPFYLLLVIRSAYYNILESELVMPIYTFGQPYGKGAYHDF